MNKQELIDKLASLVGSMEDFKGITDFHDGKYAGLEHALELIQKLDEPQKPVVPKFFDVWAKRVIAKHDEFYAISLVARAGWGYGVDFELSENGSSSENKDLLYWIIDKCSDNYPNKKKAIEALLYGYEVEKEPEYHVILSENTGGWKYTFLDEEGSIDRTNNKAHIPTFTEKKVKAIDERYWVFAVPVEEG
ncbi:hypothetical protein A5816_001714 [Enterococcus sp. 3G1_DIV0629]|uniref:DUF1642 domain-containing protein n=1 Tax=Enterococcus sp. (strain 3G1_DIV0629) TaxID=1834176 RepID=UPI000A341094|nr:DUF1642 domain-containing protein [Enterococcus sp. 3G1_DIV0629]OTO29427.1 hypothetical protein A5816_001714 [Enterococcus sp. 3G1_DIV0629]